MFKTIKTAEEALAEANQEQRERRIADLKQLLSESDYKVLPDYDKPSDEVKAQRQAWRDEIRSFEGK